MALIVETISDANVLLNAIYNKMRANKIDTWSYDADLDFIYLPDQWSLRAWFRPRLDTLQQNNHRQLTFGIISSRKYNLTKALYGVYHGRFAEMLLTHFDGMFTNIEITSLIVPGLDFEPEQQQ